MNQQQGGYQQAPPQNYGAPPQQQGGGGGNSAWKTSQGGGGLEEYILTVTEARPENNQQAPDKCNMTWIGHDHEQKAAKKAWGIGKEWKFDWTAQPPRYADPSKPGRQVNENTTMGVLLRCIDEGVPFDLRSAQAVLHNRPGGPLSPAAWQGTRWHMCKVMMDFGQGERAVIFPVAFLGTVNDPMPQVQWRTNNHSHGLAASQLAQTGPAPNGGQQWGQPQQGGQMQNHPPQGGYQQAPPQQQQQYSQQPQGNYPPPQQQYQQPAANMSAPPQYPPQQYPPQQQGQPQGYPNPNQGGGYPQGQGQFHG